MENILTFREWHMNHVKVYYDINGDDVKVTSFDKPIFSSTKKDTIINFKNNQNRELLTVYRKNFQKIQKDFTEFVETSELIS